MLEKRFLDREMFDSVCAFDLLSIKILFSWLTVVKSESHNKVIEKNVWIKCLSLAIPKEKYV